LEDIVVTSDKEIMSRSAKIVYKWDEINWHKLERSVFKLQKRIYQASGSGDWKRVHRLQRLLLKSKSAKLLSVRRVAQHNCGRKTAGIDGVKSISPEQRLELSKKLKLDEKCKPSRRVWIPKPGKTEKRPLGIPTMADRAKQALVKLALEPEWEAKFEPNSYGFRPARSCQDAQSAIFNAITRKNAYVLDADIRGCFDNIDHSALLKKLNTFSRLRQIIKKWLRSGIMEGTVFQETNAGTPQGGVISPLLANIALHGLEYETKKALTPDLLQYMKETRGKTFITNALRKMAIIRYADDFVIIHEDKEIILKAKKFVQEWLSQIGLNLSESKTRITHTMKSEDGTESGFNFLGFSIRQYFSGNRKRGYVTHIKPSLESQKKHAKTIHEVLKHRFAVTQRDVIEELNPIIRGWSNYYKTVVASKVFGRMDNYMFHKLWRWACRRHSSKGLEWIKRKYFRRYKNNFWRFRTHWGLTLVLHSETHIKRHVKVQGTRTPYDGDINYWANRLGKSVSAHDLAVRCI
jgi:RNA-directed DNA polymerase